MVILMGFERPCLQLGQLNIDFDATNPTACCHQCNTYLSKIMTTGSCRHTFCQMCCFSDNDFLPCAICKGMSQILDKRRQNEEELSKRKVICRCGIRIALKDLKSHLLCNMECFRQSYFVNINEEVRQIRTSVSQFVTSVKQNETNRYTEVSLMQQKLSVFDKVQDFFSSLRDGFSCIYNSINTSASAHAAGLRALANEVINIQATVSRPKTHPLKNAEIVQLKNIGRAVEAFSQDLTSKKVYSNAFQCAGIQWKLALDMYLDKRDECSAESFHTGLWVFPEHVGDDEQDVFPIVKTIAIDLINSCGITAKVVFKTYEDGTFRSPCFVNAGGSPCGFRAFLNYEQITALLTVGDSLEFLFRVSEIPL